ncbi:transmembrane protein 255B-like [Myxocyprinus asiaticus]|uniref:transmembrane protein 255B-like n=1 Tax=Myxocyprinus asiaticus TaxID=70543 RepID=UPI0022220C85|nr:transmembrane protein 255B-like [Myxocyprinus asiaticus]
MQQQPAPQTHAENAYAADQYGKRRRTALWCSVALFGLSVLALVIGLLCATQTDNVAVSGYYPGIILSFGAFLGVVGLNLVENRRPMLVASIIFISLGVVSCFLCAIIDGIIAAKFIDTRTLLEGRCEFYSSASGYSYENYYTEVHCHSYGNQCALKLKSNTCYCCDLHSCDSSDYHAQYYMFTGVRSCWDVVYLYRLLWACVSLNVLGVFLGIITAAILGAFKDLVMIRSQTAASPAPPPHILYNPTQHLITYTGFCPSGQTLPSYPSYPLPMQHLNSYPPPTAAQLNTEVSTSPSDETQTSIQTTTNPAVPAQSTSQDTSGYMLTPNAPSLYAHSLGPFEKPPPYAC